MHSETSEFDDETVEVIVIGYEITKNGGIGAPIFTEDKTEEQCESRK